MADVVSIDREARTVELSFSSEAAEVPRWFGLEVLSHDPGACDLSRLNDSAAVLWMHDQRDQRGVVQPGTARIDSDKVGRCTIRLSKNEDGEKLLQDIEDKIVTKVSVGYLVNGMRLIETRSGDIDVWAITAWMPYEVSLVSVPADASVGIGRSAEIPTEADPITPVQTVATVEKTEHAKPQPAEAKRNMTEEEKAAKAAADAVARQAGVDAERNRTRAIAEMGKQYGHAALAAEYISGDKSPEDFQRALLVKMAEHASKPLDEQVRAAEIGLTDREATQFSFMRAIRAQMPNATKADRDAAAFEFECSRAAEKKYDKQAQGIMVPADVLNQRTFSTTTPAGGAGDALIATQLMAGSFIDLLRNRTWLMKRATTLGGLVGNIDIPRQKSGNGAYWVGEGNEPAKGEPGMDQISFSPKQLAAMTEITRRLMKQSTPDAENIVRNDLIAAMALAIDKAGIYGTGSAFQPLGVNLLTGVNAVPFATAGKPTFAELVAMETAIALDNADVGSMSYAFNAGIRGYAKTALKFPGAAGTGTIWESGNTVNGYGTDVSNQIATGDVLFGNWADAIIAMWGGLDLTVDPYTLSGSGGTRIITFQDIDINARHVESFCVGR
ncbi:MAG TPA: phage major capsid protein [Xanthomonadaceae bacterium]|nr:phage major capsid protein [Xanthomonadaceae bacterium]